MNWNDFWKIYEQIRIPLFSGLLTIAGFLFAMKTFIIVKMKEGLYDTQEYQTLIEKKRKRNPNHSFYGGLRRLSQFLTSAIMTTLLASISQVTLGFYNSSWSVGAALLLATIAIVLLVLSIHISNCNLNGWFDQLELNAKSKETDKQKKEKDLSAVDNPEAEPLNERHAQNVQKNEK